MNELPKQIGPFTIEGEIGRGGMGVVYRATDRRLGRVVAIKAMFDKEAINSEQLARFEHEARALAALNHVNIGGIHGLEEAGDRRFLVLEFVDGETLAERLQRGPLPVAEALEIAIQMAAGLEAAHDAGIVHRDLKPANVKITSAGLVKVLDFGLARTVGTAVSQDSTVAAGSPATAAGTLLGTFPYMSPEQARGEAVDERSDIWAWAVVVLECLTGKNPFAGPTPGDTIAAILRTPIDLSSLPASTPPLAVQLLRRCLQRDVRSRMRNAGDLRLLMEECLVEGPEGLVPAAKTTQVVDKTFLIDDEICRILDGDHFDPQLIGWQMQYADNERPADVLQVWVPSFGEDHSMGNWRELLASSPYRTIVATPVGLEPKVSYRPKISMANQLSLLRHLVNSIVSRVKPQKVVVGGFS